ncbi:hypothetical protein [Clostridium neonatale]|uniref:hypothetical protein n=1 Tax=Clostridium neonatale TaxID=137838 RepID=UPI00291C3C17|nr:hypothetical protein CNEO4_240061 [Clostridium neonatale]
MADKPTKIEKEVNNVTYTREQYIENAKALGYSKPIVIGAFINCDKAELTKSEFEILIKNFLGKKVDK